MALNKAIKETGDGGTIIIENKDIQTDSGIFTVIYLALFSSVSEFWGNDIFELNINSQTQLALSENSLSKKGIESIKRAVENDLSNANIGKFTVEIIHENTDRIKINIYIEQTQVFSVVYDFMNSEVVAPPKGIGFDIIEKTLIVY